MKALTCELCGSNDIVKADGMYVCQHCGTKYTVEEAKKMLDVVKIDKSDDVEKLLVLARRARLEGNSESAEKYYDRILQEDPNNWEASFFQAYYQAYQCRIMDIGPAAELVAARIITTIPLITEYADDKEEAFLTMVDYSISIANAFANAANNHYINNSTADGAGVECKKRILTVSEIFIPLGNLLKDRCSIDTQLKVKKEYIAYVCKYRTFFGADYGQKLYQRLTSEVKAEDPSYTPPTMTTGGCYIATAVYGSYDCPEVWTLRRYRDTILAATWYGRLFIHLYYTLSPTVVKLFGDSTWFNNICKPSLDKMVVRLNEAGFQDTPYID